MLTLCSTVLRWIWKLCPDSVDKRAVINWGYLPWERESRADPWLFHIYHPAAGEEHWFRVSRHGFSMQYFEEVI